MPSLTKAMTKNDAPIEQEMAQAIRKVLRNSSVQVFGVSMLSLGLSSSPMVLAQAFPAEFELSSLAVGDGTDGLVLFGSNDRELVGRRVTSIGDINGDGFDDIMIAGQEFVANGPVYSEFDKPRNFIVFGRDTGSLTEFNVSGLGSGNGQLGFIIEGAFTALDSEHTISGAGDVNGDGLDDFIIGAPRRLTANRSNGTSFVIFGRTSSFPANFDITSLADGDGSEGFVLRGINLEDNSGDSVSSAGDVNNDGFDDIIIGAPYADPDGRVEAGESYVVFGRQTFIPEIELSSLENGDGSDGFVIKGAFADDRLGETVSDAGDLNGDGFDDFVVSAFRNDACCSTVEGPAYVVFGKDTGFGNELDLINVGSATDSSVGFVLTDIQTGSDRIISPAGDVNGDGLDDLMIGANRAPRDGEIWVGETYIIFGRTTPFPLEVSLPQLAAGDGTNGFVIRGDERGDYSGWAVSTVGDINGDSLDDLIIGAPSAARDPEINTGKSYVIYGRSTAFPPVVDVRNLTVNLGIDGFTLHGVNEFDQSGSAVSGAGDFNGDGVDDFMIGAPFADDVNFINTGEVYLMYGRSPDSDGDGVSDNLDNCLFVINVDQRDTNNDGYGNICDPDVDNNGIVNFADIALWTPFFNSQNDGDFDFTGDGNVNFLDFSILIEYFLSPPGPSGLISE